MCAGVVIACSQIMTTLLHAAVNYSAAGGKK